MEDMIRTYEESFFSKEFCENEEKLRERIHPDYLEYGLSGKVYRFEEELNYLMNLDKDRPLSITKYTQEYLSDDVILVHYESCEQDTGNCALRTSIWKKVGDHWQIYFHQGSKIRED